MQHVMNRLALVLVACATCLALTQPALAASRGRPKPTPTPRNLATPMPAVQPLSTNHDHNLEYMEDTSKDPDALLRAYRRNSHLQKLLDLGLYQLVFDDDPEGVESFLAAGAKLEGLPELPLTPMGFASWRHETRTIATLLAHGAQPVQDTTDPDALVRKTVETVTGVADLVVSEMKAAEAEYRRTASRH